LHSYEYDPGKDCVLYNRSKINGALGCKNPVVVKIEKRRGSMFGYSKTNDVLGSVNRGGAPVGQPCIVCRVCRMGEERNAATAREMTADTGFP
jgi:hypothetical protein